MMKTKLLQTVALVAMMLVPTGAGAQVENPVVDDFTQLFKKAEKAQTLDVSGSATTATSAYGSKTVYKVASLTTHDETSYNLKNQIYLEYGSKEGGQWTKFSGYGTSSSELGTGYLQFYDKKKVVSIQGLKLGDVVKITCGQASYTEDSEGIFIRSPYVCYYDGDNTYKHITSINSTWKVADQALISDREYIMTSDGSFDFGHSASSTYTVSKISVKSPQLNASGYATFSFPFNVVVSGVEAYTATLDTGNKTITCTKITDGKVPAGTGVLLYGDANAVVTLTKLDVAPDALTGNDLIGTTQADGSLKAKDGSKTQYVLSGDTFKKFTGSAFTAGKAYFETETAVSAPSFDIVFTDNNTTAIQQVGTTGKPTTGVKKYVKNGRLVIETANGTFTATGAQIK